jgi:hypothetical protein
VSVNKRVREAIGRIEPLRFSRGPNFYTVDVDGWGLSAPSKPQLSKMLWDWFNDERPLIVAFWDQIGTRTNRESENQSEN